MKHHQLHSLILLLFLFAAPAVAQEGVMDSPQDYSQMSPFTQGELVRFLHDWPAFTRWAESRGEELDQSGNGDAWTREAASFVTGLGWEHERFFYVAHQCAVGVSGLAMNAQQPAIMAEISEVRQRIVDDPTMTDEQKQQMLQMLEESQGGMLEMQDMQEQIHPQEMALIKVSEPEIRRVLQVEQ